MWILQHTAGLLVLTLLVAALCRGLRFGPAARHALWLLVLLKLLTPPFVAWPWAIPVLPSAEPNASPGALSSLVISFTESSDTLLPVEESGLQPPLAGFALWDRPAELGATAWLCGGLLVAFVQIRRLRRLQREHTDARLAPAWLRAEVARGAAALGIRPPPAAVLPGLSSPCIWAGWRTRLLWPEGLENNLSPEGCRAVLVHELAHLARRDHWIGRLLLLAGCVWWWHPLFYLVRCHLHRQAELACDARVIAVLPDARRDYAEALLDVCQRQSEAAAAAPALGALGRRHDLERRIVMIMRANEASRLSPRMLAAIGFLGLVVLPAWTFGQVKTPAKPGQPATADRDKQLKELEKKLQAALKELEEQRKGKHVELVVPMQKNEKHQEFALSFIDPAKPAEDKKLRDFEAKVQALLKEAKTLRGGKPPIKVDVNQALTGSFTYDLGIVTDVDTLVTNLYAAPAVSLEIALSRTTYKLPAAKAEALGKFLQEHVKAVIMETKSEGDNLTITTTPEVQQGIRQFIALIEGKKPHSGGPRWEKLPAAK